MARQVTEEVQIDLPQYAEAKNVEPSPPYDSIIVKIKKAKTSSTDYGSFFVQAGQIIFGTSKLYFQLSYKLLFYLILFII
jgi:hypothetical protein